MNEDVIGKRINGIEVQNVAGLPAFLEENDIQIGVICTQKESAQEICDELVAGGIKAIWNFAPG